VPRVHLRMDRARERRQSAHPSPAWRFPAPSKSRCAHQACNGDFLDGIPAGVQSAHVADPEPEGKRNRTSNRSRSSCSAVRTALQLRAARIEVVQDVNDANTTTVSGRRRRCVHGTELRAGGASRSRVKTNSFAPAAEGRDQPVQLESHVREGNQRSRLALRPRTGTRQAIHPVTHQQTCRG
jgi:hypothetical protein